MARVTILVHAIGLPFLVFITIASAIGWGDLYRWTTDPQTLTAARPWDGAISHLGMIAWSSAVAISVFVALSHWRVTDRQMGTLLLSGGLVTAFLLVDDLFLVHDHLLPEVGIPEIVAVVGVALVPMIYLWIFRQTIIRRTPWAVLAIAVVYLAVMVVVDALEHEIVIPLHHLWEEGAKFLGILHWCAYMVLVSWLVMTGPARETSDRVQDGTTPRLSQ